MTSTRTKRWCVLSALALAAFWALLSRLISSPLILPSPYAVAREIVTLATKMSFWKAAGASGARVLVGFCLSLAIGVTAGILCARFSPLRAFCALPVALVRCVPVVSFVLLALFWLDSDALPVLIAVLMGFPLFFTSALSGFQARDEGMAGICCVFALTRTQRFCFLKLPLAAPFLKDAARNSCGLIWKACAAAEVLCVPRFALGAELQSAQVVLEIQRVFAVTVYIVAFGFSSEWLLEIGFRLAAWLYRALVRAYFDHDRRVVTKQKEQREEDFALKIDNLSFSYGDTNVLENYSESFGAHKVTAIIAPSGAGKTTLLNYTAQNYPSVSYATQTPRLFTHLTTLENVSLPLKNLFDGDRACGVAKEVLVHFGLEGKEGSFPHELSGGERQRVSLARAAAFPSSLLLLDEPFASLDTKTKRKCVSFILEAQHQHPRTTLFATHDIKEAVALSDVIILHTKGPMRQIAHFPVSPSDKTDSTRLEEEVIRALLQG